MAKRDPQTPSESEFTPEIEHRLDPLYRESPDEFVASRNALAIDLRGEGDRSAGAAVRKLRRPSQAAWLINRVAADEPERVRRFVAAVDELADAQRRVLGGDADPAELREAAAGERREIDGVVAAARGVAGARASAAILDRVAETLHAAGSNDELRARMLRGRVEKESSAATIGLSGLEGVAARPRSAPKRSGRREVERARLELARLRERLDVAVARRDHEQSRVDTAESDLRRAKADLAAAKREVRALERDVGKAERNAADE